MLHENSFLYVRCGSSTSTTVENNFSYEIRFDENFMQSRNGNSRSLWIGNGSKTLSTCLAIVNTQKLVVFYLYIFYKDNPKKYFVARPTSTLSFVKYHRCNRGDLFTRWDSFPPNDDLDVLWRMANSSLRFFRFLPVRDSRDHRDIASRECPGAVYSC